MRIDGKAIAEKILADLTDHVTSLKSHGVTPTFAVIVVGDDVGSLSYVKQKQITAERIGAKFIFEHLPANTSADQLRGAIEKYDRDTTIDSLIVQQPLPKPLDITTMYQYIDPKKDVDGFVQNSPFDVPVAAAVLEIFKNIQPNNFLPWLQSQKIAIIGRGETAGKPIAALLAKKECTTSIIHSQTENPTNILKESDIIISCVGKEKTITSDMIKPGAILVSVGIYRGIDGKLHGDYEEEDIQDIASFYTPTPGGVGPVNVACLMQNLLQACTIKQGGQL